MYCKVDLFTCIHPLKTKINFNWERKQSEPRLQRKRRFLSITHNFKIALQANTNY